MPILIAGVDEAGRGPLAGPVSAAAVILDPNFEIKGLADSKALTEKQREKLDKEIKQKCLAWAIASASVEEIDKINILQASLLAMQRAVAALKILPQKILVDGNKAPDFGIEAIAIIGGDAIEPAISAASILAKVWRDELMLKLHAEFPEYQFADHKGYATKKHRENIKKYGPCVHHRKSFAPIKDQFTEHA